MLKQPPLRIDGAPNYRGLYSKTLHNYLENYPLGPKIHESNLKVCFDLAARRLRAQLLPLPTLEAALSFPSYLQS